MRTLFITFAIAFVVGPAAASEKTDVMVPVHQFTDSLNKGDTKTALATCAATSAIIDEFPPYQWQGATACTDWVNEFDAYNKKNGITNPIATLAKPRHIDITGDRAYVVIPASYTYKQHGKKMTESGSTLTVALQKGAAGWQVTSWAWSKH